MLDCRAGTRLFSAYRRLGWIFPVAALFLLPAAAKADCTLTASGVAFGPYDPLSGEAVDSRGDLEVAFAASTSYTVALSEGQGTFSTRQMSNGLGTLLGYNLYTDVARQIIWGDGAGVTQIVSGTADATGNEHGIYGYIPGDQNVTAGSYSDTIVVTLTY